ncbi:F-box protein CPR1-like [Silene latifolia]|uniref:F-box protein CPR1-like n=1 Tax=Silene latifolia TaxID=37657 RepID=UPI003D77FE63
MVSISFGFGFDDLNDDYKLVRVTDVKSFNQILPKHVVYREVMVYSLNQSTWKLAERVKDPIDSLMVTQNGALIKNHLLHWLFSDSDHCRIGCFDTRSDKWVRDVPLMQLMAACKRSLGVINGCLCLSTTTTSSGILWMLKDYEAKESWIKLFHVTPLLSSHSFQFTQPFFCFPRESKYEVLLANVDRDGLFWFDIGQPYGRIKSVKRIPAFVGGCLFTESLVQIRGGRHIT